MLSGILDIICTINTKEECANSCKFLIFSYLILWALTDSNRRPSACKADALNQLS